MTHKSRGWEDLDRSKLSITVFPDEIETFGAGPAVLLQQIRFWSVHPRNEHPGWFTGKAEELAHLTGLSPKQVRTAMGSLVEAGVVVREQLGLKNWERCYSYRVEEAPSPLFAEVPKRSPLARRDQTGSSSRGDQTGSSSSLSDGTDEIPPSPPEGEKSSGQLFDQNAGKPKNRRARQRPAVISEPMVKALADRIWKSWPKKSGRDTFDRALLRILDEGGAITEVDAWVANYLETHRAYREIWNRKPPEMNLGTFLNGKARDFEDGPVNPDRWPAPTGEDWERWRGEQRFYAANGHQDAVSPWCELAEVFG